MEQRHDFIESFFRRFNKVSRLKTNVNQFVYRLNSNPNMFGIGIQFEACILFDLTESFFYRQ
jgi:hypothetical protein